MNCKNCFKFGHTFYQCKKPIRSYGVILYKMDTNKKKYLMICRKHSFGFSTIIRGKYDSTNIEQMKNLIDTMTLQEKEMILTKPFEDNWNYLWTNSYTHLHTNEKNYLEIKFDKNHEIFATIIGESTTQWNEPEWEFPKGRMQQNETEMDCAIREFEEETHISKHNINIIYNVCPFEEVYISNNNKSYKIIYYLAKLKTIEPNMESFQEEEVSKMEWKDLEQCLSSIRPYNREKLSLIQSLEDILNDYGVA